MLNKKFLTVLSMMGLFSQHGYLAKANADVIMQQPTKIYKAKYKGCSTFKYDDGFECVALNQKNADRKHNNWRTQPQPHYDY